MIKTNYAKIILVFCLLIIIMASYFYFFLYSPQQENIIKESLTNKIEMISKLSKPIFYEALRKQEDLVLISQVENLTKMEDIKTAYILDNTGKVITHNNVNEWGKIYENNITKKFINSNKGIIQMVGKDVFFSVPLENKFKLIVGLSLDRINQKFSVKSRNVLYSFVLVFFVMFSFFAIVSFYLIKLPVRKIEKKLGSLALDTGERITDDKENEFDRINMLIDVVSERKKNARISENENKMSEYNDFLISFDKMFSDYELGYVLIGSDNKINRLNKKAEEFLHLKNDSLIGKHILEVINDRKILELLRISKNNPNKTFNEIIKDREIKIVSVSDKQEVNQSTIIVVKPRTE